MNIKVKGGETVTIIILQVAVLAGILLTLKLVSFFSRKPVKKNQPAMSLLPVVLIFFIWQLSHGWGFSWLAIITIGWMVLCILATIYLAVNRGEILWHQFLMVFNRVSYRYLFLGYVTTLGITIWMLR